MANMALTRCSARGPRVAKSTSKHSRHRNPLGVPGRCCQLWVCDLLLCSSSSSEEHALSRFAPRTTAYADMSADSVIKNQIDRFPLSLPGWWHNYANEGMTGAVTA